jgi:hypothetical protein
MSSRFTRHKFWVYQIGFVCLVLAASALTQEGGSGQRGPAPPVKAGALRRLPELKAGVLHGRFVAESVGPRISAFSPNVEIFIFEADLRGYTQLIKLSHEFLHQEPRFPAEIMDYNRLQSLEAARDPSCDEAWGSLSTRVAFDREGELTGKRSALIFAQASPQLSTAEDEVLPCYVVGRVTANTLRQVR